MNARDPEQQLIPPEGFPPLQADHRPHQRLDVHARVVDGEAVILDRAGGFIHQLNRTASYIWDRCDGQSTLAEMANQLAEAFDVEDHTAVTDVATTVERLYQLNLLAPSEGMSRGTERATGEGRNDV